MKANEFIIVHFGYLYPDKGIEVLLKAFKIICGRKTNVRLLTVGDEPPASANPLYVQQLREWVKQPELEGKIIWTGNFTWNSNEASLYLRAGDTCVLPFTSGVSLNRSSVAAAAVHGLPIITTKGRHLESAFVDHKNVLLCQPNDDKALAEAIESLIADPELRQRLSAGATELADRWFSWDKALAGTIEALRYTS
jgi:glycosyltransferase involved in cell wall biosynthesis